MLKRILTISAIPLVVAAVMWFLLIRPMNKPLPAWAGGPVSGPPAICLWGGQSAIPIEPPKGGQALASGSQATWKDRGLLFAAWEDGTVVRRVPNPTSKKVAHVGTREDGTSYLYADDRYAIFRTDPAQVRQVLNEIGSLGWSAPITESFLRWNSGTMCDGPALKLEVRCAEGLRAREYHGRFDRLDYLGAGPPPSPQEVGEFKAMWRSALTAIGKVPLTEVGEYTGTPPVE